MAAGLQSPVRQTASSPTRTNRSSDAGAIAAVASEHRHCRAGGNGRPARSVRPTTAAARATSSLSRPETSGRTASSPGPGCTTDDTVSATSWRTSRQVEVIARRCERNAGATCARRRSHWRAATHWSARASSRGSRLAKRVDVETAPRGRALAAGVRTVAAVLAGRHSAKLAGARCRPRPGKPDSPSPESTNAAGHVCRLAVGVVSILNPTPKPSSPRPTSSPRNEGALIRLPSDLNVCRPPLILPVRKSATSSAVRM